MIRNANSGKSSLVIVVCYTLIIATLSIISSGLANNEVFRPHIIFILADDLGWNDLGFHGSSQIPTPNLDALAYSGLILNRQYVTPICTPSRAALMTAKYPIHTGMQHTVIFGAEPWGLPLSEKLLPEYLNELGYSSHIVGKWHLGHFKREYTPLYRGFKTHIGYWTGRIDYFDHTSMESGLWGLDFRRGLDVAHDLHGKYTTDVIKDEAVQVIRHHNSSAEPLFLYVAHAAVHSGNPYSPLPAPDDKVSKMDHIYDYNRRKYAAMLSKLDDSVGAIVHQLQQQNMLKDSIIVFSSDNGGPAEGFNNNAASNWPLRGVKNTLWEGGVRGAALFWSGQLQRRGRVLDQSIHITDWLPTLYRAAGGEAKNLKPNLDGIDVWDVLNEDVPSERLEILHNIDDIYGSASLTNGDWKVIKGTNYKGQWDSWYGPAGSRSESSYRFHDVTTSLAGTAIASLGVMPQLHTMRQLRSKATVNCEARGSHSSRQADICRPLESPCLFNVRDDPCEYYNIAQRFPSILSNLLRRLESYNSTAIPPNNKPADPRADPKFWDYTWTNFGDYNVDLTLKNGV